nr:gamma-glutamyl-gamma-aminobutyrate hydrolase family protein [Planosporangium thailandense]
MTTYRERAQSLVWDTDFALLHQVYVDAVVAAGGTAVLLPPQPASAANVLARLDGLVLTGGADVEPNRYGHTPGLRTGAPRRDRDEWELALAHAALDLDLPVLGVCRGLQVLNVALGGTLEQHVPDRVGHTGHQPAPGRFGHVHVRVRAASRLAALVGEDLTVSCYHHQSIAVLAPDLSVVGVADDGTIEAVESARRPFLLAVQWHPEQDSTDRRLFQGLVDAARRRVADGAPTHA